MSKMADLMIEIEECLNDGFQPKTVAALLNCPVDMVYDAIEHLMLEDAN